MNRQKLFKEAASTSGGLNGKALGAVEEKPDLLKHGVVGAQTHGSRVDSAASFLVGHTKSSETYVVEAKPVLDKGKDALLELESPGCGVAADPTGVAVSGLPDRKVVPDEVHNVPQTSELEGARPIDMKQEVHRSPGVFAVSEDLSSSEQPRDNGKGPKKAKTLKRPVSEMSSDKHTLLEKKKKRKREFGIADKHVIIGKGETPGGEVSRKVDQGGYVPKEELWVDHLKKDDGRTSLLSDSVGSPSVAGMENAKFEFPQLLSNLQALAINPFYGTGGISPVILQHVFLRFRSLVYEKSLALLPVPEAEPSEVHAAQYPSSRDLPALKPQRTLMRPDDPTKAGRKRGPSDRQEEMATKKLKKINQLKTLTGEKKAVQKKSEVQRGDSPVVHPKPVKFEPTATKKSEQGDEQELASAVPPKPVKLDSTRKPEPPAARKSGFPAKDPTTLVMKFSPSTNLPSPSELKARLARFGPLDHLGTRVFYTSSTCRVVFLYKPDAHAAQKHLMKNKSLFGNMILRCFLREAGGPSDPESVKVRTEDGSVEMPPPRESVPATSAHQQSTTQLKSCLKKSSGDEIVSVAGGGVNGGSRGTPRVKFILGEEEDVKGEQLRVGNKNNKINNNATSFADGGASSSSSSHAMDVNSKNFQKVVVPPPPLPTPILVTSSSAQFPNNLYSTEVAYGKTHNVTATPSMAPPPSNTTNNVDIAPQMLSLLTRCNDVVNNVKSFLGYLPYHPL